MNLGRESSCFSEMRDSIKVGNYSMIAAECYFHEPNDHHLVKYNKKCVFTDNCRQPHNGREIEIGNDVWIGRGAKLLPGVHIGDGAIIGAWSVVSKDIPPFAVAAGAPIKIIRFRFDREDIEKLEQLKWWDWEADKVAQAREDMLDISLFLKKYG